MPWLHLLGDTTTLQKVKTVLKVTLLEPINSLSDQIETCLH